MFPRAEHQRVPSLEVEAGNAELPIAHVPSQFEAIMPILWFVDEPSFALVISALKYLFPVLLIHKATIDHSLVLFQYSDLFNLDYATCWMHW